MKARSSNLALILALASMLALNSLIAFAAEKKSSGWEALVLEGNELRDREHLPDARRVYQSALKVLDKQNVFDIRRALILHNMADTCRTETNFHQARMLDMQSAEIYKQEIKNHQLGYEYSSQKPVSLSSGSLRPACYICHENWKVVPILYGKTSGYPGETPPDSDDSYTHKPGGPEFGYERWYCRDCHQSF